MSETTFIYALKDPTTGAIRYIGKTKNPRGRFSSHISNIRRENNHRARWIRSLLVRGFKPTLEIIDEVPVLEWPQWEVAYIEFFREQDCDLVNSHAGGLGAHNPTGETRAKISASRALYVGERHPMFGKPRSAETLVKMSAAAKGKTASLETRSKMSIARLGKKFSPEACANIRAAKLGKKNPNFGEGCVARSELGRFVSKQFLDKPSGNPHSI